MERGICPMTVIYFAIINVRSLTLRTVVDQQRYKFYYSVIVTPFWVT